MTAALHDLSLTEAAEALDAGRTTPTELTEAMLARIEALNPALHAWQHVRADAARAEAATAEAERARGLRRGPLHGVPVGVKDLCRTLDAPTAAGMKILEGSMDDHEATVVARLRGAGAVILGKLAMTEGAFAAHHPEMPTPVNPFAPDRWVGSSSSGSGSATAAGLCYGSLGSDTGGSIRFPSHCNGLTGLKGTWGRVSRHGVYALADSLDHVGPMARTAKDCAAMMTVLAGPDPLDPTSLRAPVPDYLAECEGGVSGLRIGLDAAMLAAIDPAVAVIMEDAARVLESLGARIVPVTLPDDAGVEAAWNALCFVECLVAHAPHWPARKAEYGPILGAVLTTAERTTQAELAAAMHRRLVYNGAWAGQTEGVDMTIMPILSGPTPTLDAWNAFLSGESEGGDLGGLLRWTAPADFTGDPALTLPAGLDAGGAPVGVQLVGPKLTEDRLLRAGHAFQTATEHHLRRPDLSALG